MKSVAQPIAVSEKTAASMLEMPVSEFLRLVGARALPGPVEICPGFMRWRVADLEAVVSGDAALPKGTEDIVV